LATAALTQGGVVLPLPTVVLGVKSCTELAHRHVCLDVELAGVKKIAMFLHVTIFNDGDEDRS
jgi:hypothetical protein